MHDRALHEKARHGVRLRRRDVRAMFDRDALAVVGDLDRIGRRRRETSEPRGEKDVKTERKRNGSGDRGKADRPRTAALRLPRAAGRNGIGDPGLLVARPADGGHDALDFAFASVGVDATQASGKMAAIPLALGVGCLV